MDRRKRKKTVDAVAAVIISEDYLALKKTKTEKYKLLLHYFSFSAIIEYIFFI